MMAVEHTVLSREYITIYHKMYSVLIWIMRGAIKDNDYHRIQQDYHDAKELVGFRLGNEILEELLEGHYFPVPDYYYEYLSSVTIERYKQLKAYFIYLERAGRYYSSPDQSKEDYLKACSFLPYEESLVLEGCFYSSRTLLDYISVVNMLHKILAKSQRQRTFHEGEIPKVLFEGLMSTKIVTAGKGSIKDVKETLKKGISGKQ